MKTPFLVGIVFFLFSELLLSQNTFQKTFGTPGNDRGYTIINTSDGNLILVGTSMATQFDPTNGVIIKLNTNGDTIWSKVYSPNLILKKIIELPSGDFFISGESQIPTGDSDYFFMKINSMGDSLWTKIYGGTQTDLIESIQLTSDNGLIALGRTGSFGFNFNGAIQLIKLDSVGGIQWNKILPQYYIVNSLVQNGDGSCVIVGIVRAPIVNNYCITKFDSLGNIVWSRAYQGEFINSEYAVKIIKLENGNYVIGGYLTRYQNTPASLLILFNLDSLGNLVWTRSFSSGYNNSLSDLIQTKNKEFAVLGNFEAMYGINSIYRNYFLMKTDSSGNFLWSKSYGGSNMDDSYSLTEGLDKSLYMLGETKSMGIGLSDMYLIKTDSLGNTNCNEIPINTIETSCILTEQTVTHSISSSYNQYFKNIANGSGISVYDPCTPTSINNNILNINTISAFPNPFINTVNISYSLGSEYNFNNTTLEIVNLLGEVLDIKNIKSNQGIIQLNLNLVAGLYIARLKRNNDIIVSQKIVKYN